MMIYIQIDESLEPTSALAGVDQQVIERAAQQTLLYARTDPKAEVTIVLSDDAQLHALNLQFLGIDVPTDVLSFPGGDTDPDSEALYLGDVIISLSRARAQAAAGGHSVQDELQLLVVHGVLHLLGHDHAEADEKESMWSAQTEILVRLGCNARP